MAAKSKYRLLRPDGYAYTYQQTEDGYLLPAEVITEKRRLFWIRWQQHGLPVPNEVSGSTGLLHRAASRERSHE